MLVEWLVNVGGLISDQRLLKVIGVCVKGGNYFFYEK